MNGQPPPDGYVVKTLNLWKVYGKGRLAFPALKGVNLNVKKGEMVAIVGPSGSGKSTLLNLLGALDHPTQGKVFIENIDVFGLNDNALTELRNRKIGFVFQAFNLIQRISALKNVEVPLMTRNISREKRRRLAANMLKAVGLGDKLNQRPTELSGGEQQRVALARALVIRPTILLGDEITGNLDSKTAMEIIGLIRNFNRTFGTTVILVTHNMQIANQTDRIIYLRDGVIEKEETLVKNNSNIGG